MNDEKMLTFNDILLVPQLSTLKSRDEADTSVTLGKGKRAIKLGLPVIASPMDTVCEADMLVAMALEGGLGVIHRYMDVDKQCDEVRKARDILVKTHKITNPNIGAAIGATGDFLYRFSKLVDAGANVICIDVAHGHHTLVKEALKKIEEEDELRDLVHIMAGNVATAEAFRDLSNWGADSIRVGVGGGCFLPGSKVLTEEGFKNIEDIEIGDYVFGHQNKFEKVEDTLTFAIDEDVYDIDGIKCTGNHEFYVINCEDESKVNDLNLQNFAFWVKAKDLDKNKHLLLEF